ncbi:MAG: hypothetical protein JW909_06715 [Planctomycetes bacterium]|nr:hypothetical protein [Planctomycetota bacterium]
MHKSRTPQPLLVALGLRDDEITRSLEQAAASIAALRSGLSSFGSSDISSWTSRFASVIDRLKLATMLRRGILRKTGISDSSALDLALQDLPPDVRPSVVGAESRLKAASLSLRRELRSLNYFARLHLSHLDGILSAIGEATGLKATYRPGTPPISGNLGIVDATA